MQDPHKQHKPLRRRHRDEQQVAETQDAQPTKGSHPEASPPPGKKAKNHGFSEGLLDILQACERPIDQLRIVTVDGKIADIWADISLSKLTPQDKALLKILQEDGTEPTEDSVVPFKTHEYIAMRLGDCSASNVRMRILRLKEGIAECGLNPNLIERQKPTPDGKGNGDTKQKDNRWPARFKVQSAFTAAWRSQQKQQQQKEQEG